MAKEEKPLTLTAQQKRRAGLEDAGMHSIPVHHLDGQTLKFLNRLSVKLGYKDPECHERSRSWTYSNVITYLVREHTDSVKLNPQKRDSQELFRCHRIVEALTKTKKGKSSPKLSDIATFMDEHGYIRPSILGRKKRGWTAADIKRLRSDEKVQAMVRVIDDDEE